MKINKIKSPISHFFTEQVSSKNLSAFRILSAGALLSFLVMIQPDFVEIYKSDSFIPTEVSSIFLPDYQPRLSWIYDIIQLDSAKEPLFLQSLWWVYAVIACLLMIGFITRITAFLAFIIQIMLIGTGIPYCYGFDWFLAASLFYCTLFPVHHYWSIDKIMFKTEDKNVPIIYTRYLQIHLCLVYFFAGFSKALGTTWWTGDALWRSLNGIDFKVLNMERLASFPLLLQWAGIGVIIIEMLYPFWIYYPRTRLLALTLVITMHIGIGVFMNLALFGLILIIWNICAFYNFRQNKENINALFQKI